MTLFGLFSLFGLLKDQKVTKKVEKSIESFPDVVRCLHPFCGENASELEETFGWKTEIRWPASANAREHQAGELDVIKIRTWNTIVG